MRYDLTIIIVSYNTKAITLQCLGRVEKAKAYCEEKLRNKVSVIVVDNASTDGSAQMIRRKFPKVRLIKLKENIGFARANNTGMKASKTPYILLINSDTFLEEHTLYKSLEYMEKSDCDVLGIKLTYKDGGFQPAGGYLPTPMRTFLWLLGLESVPLVKKIIKPIYLYNEKAYKLDRELGWLTGSFWMLRRKVHEKTGGFDKEIFLYMEDVEWCKRIKSAGFKICYTPTIKAIHLEGASSKKLGFGAVLERHTKGLIYYQKINYPRSLWFIRWVAIYGYFLRAFYYYLSGETEKADSYSKVRRKLLTN